MSLLASLVTLSGAIRAARDAARRAGRIDLAAGLDGLAQCVLLLVGKAATGKPAVQEVTS